MSVPSVVVPAASDKFDLRTTPPTLAHSKITCFILIRGPSAPNKFIFSLTFTNKIKHLLYNDLETTYRLYKIGNLGITIIFKEIAKYAESLPWYNIN